MLTFYKCFVNSVINYLHFFKCLIVYHQQIIVGDSKVVFSICMSKLGNNE